MDCSLLVCKQMACEGYPDDVTRRANGWRSRSCNVMHDAALISPACGARKPGDDDYMLSDAEHLGPKESI